MPTNYTPTSERSFTMISLVSGTVQHPQRKEVKASFCADCVIDSIRDPKHSTIKLKLLQKNSKIKKWMHKKISVVFPLTNDKDTEKQNTGSHHYWRHHILWMHGERNQAETNLGNSSLLPSLRSTTRRYLDYWGRNITYSPV